MNREEIFGKVKEIIANKLNLRVGGEDLELTEDSNLFNDLGGDSLDAVEIMMELEKEFDIQIPDAEAEGNLATLGSITTLVYNIVLKQSAS